MNLVAETMGQLQDGRSLLAMHRELVEDRINTHREGKVAHPIDSDTRTDIRVRIETRVLVNGSPGESHSE